MNEITFNKRLGSLTDKCFEMQNVSYTQPLVLIVNEDGSDGQTINGNYSISFTETDAD